MELRIRLYEIKTEEQINQFNNIYDNLWKPQYYSIAEKNNLICKEIVCSDDNILSMLNTLYPNYEGFTIQITDLEKDVVIYGGVFDDTYTEYVISYINEQKEQKSPNNKCEYIVWCGGIEVCNSFLTLKKAIKLYIDYVNDDYDDVYIEHLPNGYETSDDDTKQVEVLDYSDLTQVKYRLGLGEIQVISLL
jgi:hypothetical protein